MFKRMIAIIGVCTLLAGCSNDGVKALSEVASSVEEKVGGESAEASAKAEEETVMENTEMDSTDAGVSGQTDTGASEQADAGSLESFISGAGKLSFDYYGKNVFKSNQEYLSNEDEILQDIINSGKDYTLAEFRDKLNEIFNSEDNYLYEGEVQSISYAYIDCGNDGVKELALEMVGPFADPTESTMTFIIKELDGKPELVYAFSQWSRSETSINKYGFISGGGSNSASNHGYDEAYINADGKYMYGFYEEEEYDINAFGMLRDHDDFDAEGLDNMLAVYTLRLDQYDAANPQNEYYSYNVYDSNTYEEVDVPNLYTDSKYKDIMDSFKDISFISMDEMKKMEKEKMESIGVTDEIRNAEVPEYTEVKI